MLQNDSHSLGGIYKNTHFYLCYPTLYLTYKRLFCDISKSEQKSTIFVTLPPITAIYDSPIVSLHCQIRR